MLNITIITFFFVLPLLYKCEHVNVNYKYGYENYEHIKNINRCLVISTDPVRHENMDVNVINIQTTYGGQNNPSKIEGFEAEKKQIFFFPGKIGHHFPNLRVVKIQTSSLRKITSEDFKLICNLEFLDLNNNLILILPANLFQYTQKLQIIWLKGNKIYYIHPTAFNGLINLISLDIYDNTCYTGGAKNIEEALIISSLSLCSNELLYSCGAFSNALNLISSSSSSYSQDFQMTNAISTEPVVLKNIQKLMQKQEIILNEIKNLQQILKNTENNLNGINIPATESERNDNFLEKQMPPLVSNIPVRYIVYAMIIMTSIMYITSIVILCYLYKKK